MKHFETEFEEFSNNLDVFIQAVRAKPLSLLATDQWNVKDLLAHIVFWHENYAANYNAMAMNKVPPLFVGPGYKLNDEGVATLGKVGVEILFERLASAQKSLYESIVDKGVPEMKYKADGRIYKTKDFLHLIGRHFLTHATQVKRAK